MEYRFGKRYESLERDPDFQEYAALWREYEIARSNFRRKNIPRVVGIAANNTPVFRVPWIKHAERENAIQLQYIKARYNKEVVGAANKIPANHDVRTTLSQFGDLVSYRDRIALQELNKAQTQLPVQEARFIRQWSYVHNLIKLLASNRYARRMDPAVYGPGKEPSNPDWYALYEKLDLDPAAATFSTGNAERERALESMLL